jgi:hypothetical protein
MDAVTNRSDNVINTNQNDGVNKEACALSAKILGATAGVLAGIAVFFATLTSTLPAMGFVAIPVALGAGIAAGVAVGISVAGAVYKHNLSTEKKNQEIIQLNQENQRKLAEIRNDLEKNIQNSNKVNDDKLETINTMLKDQTNCLKKLETELKDKDQQIQGFIYKGKEQIKVMENTPGNKELTPEKAIGELKILTEHLYGEMNKAILEKNKSDQAFEQAKTMIEKAFSEVSKFPGAEIQVAQIKEIQKMNDNIKSLREKQFNDSKEITDQLITAMFKFNTKLMSAEDRNKVLNHFNNETFGHIVKPLLK